MKKNYSLVSRYRLKMISRKAIYAIVAALIYAILITAYLKFPKDLFVEKDENKNCNSKSPCIRFCLKDVENRTNLWLFNLFNVTRLSKRKPDGYSYVLDVEGSEDDTVIKKKEKKKGKDKKKYDEIPDYGAGDYTYDDVGREQKMKGKGNKREVKDLNLDYEDFDDTVEEQKTQLVMSTDELAQTTEYYDYNYSNYEERQRVKRKNMSEDELNELNSTDNKEIKIKILRESPKCIDRTIEDPFFSFRLIFKLGGEFINISSPKVTYNHEEYCLQEREIKILPKFNAKVQVAPKPKTEWIWDLNICHNTDIDPKAYRYVAYFSSSLIMGIVLIIYNGYDELKDTRGKCLINLLASHLVIFGILTVTRVLDMFVYGIYEIIVTDLILFAFFMALLFLLFMGLHTIWRLWNFKRIREDRDIFVIYATIIGIIAVGSACGLAFCQYFVETFDFNLFVYDATYILYMSLVVIGVFCMVFSFFLMIKTSEVLKKYQAVRYQREVEWFWMHTEIFVVMMITWPFFKISYEEASSPDFIPSIFVDLIILFSGMNVFAIFAVREKTRKATASAEF